MNSLSQNRDHGTPGRRNSAERHVAVSIAAPSLQLFNKIEEVIPLLETFKIPYEISIVAAHRIPNRA